MTLKAERLAVSTLSTLSDMEATGRSDADRLAFLRDTFDSAMPGDPVHRRLIAVWITGRYLHAGLNLKLWITIVRTQVFRK